MFVLQVCPQRATACLSQDVDRICKPPCSNRPNYSWNREIIKEVSPRTIRLGWLLLWTRPVGKGVEKTDWFVAIYDQHSLFRPPPSVSLPLSLSPSSSVLSFPFAPAVWMNTPFDTSSRLASFDLPRDRRDVLASRTSWDLPRTILYLSPYSCTLQFRLATFLYRRGRRPTESVKRRVLVLWFHGKT